jgi:hypothetical protein
MHLAPSQRAGTSSVTYVLTSPSKDRLEAALDVHVLAFDRCKRRV